MSVYYARIHVELTEVFAGYVVHLYDAQDNCVLRRAFRDRDAAVEYCDQLEAKLLED